MEGDVSQVKLKNITSSEKETGNQVIGVDGMEKFIHLPFNKKDKYFRNPDDFVKFVNACERSIRHAPEYTRYIAYLKGTIGLNSCALFRNVDGASAPIEFHHNVFTLYDIVEIQIAHLFKNGDRINSAYVTHNVLKDHWENIILVVPLCEAAHKAYHASQATKGKDRLKFFIPIEACFGNFSAFLEKYSEDLTMQQVIKLKNYLKDFEEWSKLENHETPDFFKGEVTMWKDKFDEGGIEGNDRRSLPDGKTQK